MSRHMLRRLMQLGVVEPRNYSLITRLPFNGTLSPDERRMLDQGAFIGNFQPVYSTIGTEAPKARLVRGRATKA